MGDATRRGLRTCSRSVGARSRVTCASARRADASRRSLGTVIGYRRLLQGTGYLNVLADIARQLGAV